MRFTFGLLTPVACVAVLLTPAAHHLLIAEGENRAALAGQITSSEEGPMEGVLVSVKKAGSTQTITVVTDQQGRYRFPDSRLEAGEYALAVRAIGFDLESEASDEQLATLQRLTERYCVVLQTLASSPDLSVSFQRS